MDPTAHLLLAVLAHAGLALALHELGHAAAGWMVGGQVRWVGWRRHPGQSPWDVGVEVKLGETSPERPRRRTVVLLSGPLANLACAAALFMLPVPLSVPGGAVHLWCGLINLWPHGGPWPSDGAQVLSLWRRRSA